MKKIKLIILSFSIFTVFFNASTVDSANTNCIILKKDIRLYSEDTNVNGEVSKLQTFLKNKGYYSGEINGYYNRLTSKAVLAFQKANNIKLDKSNSTMYSALVGPKTREKIMYISCIKDGKILRNISATPLPKAAISATPSPKVITTPSYTPKITTLPSEKPPLLPTNITSPSPTTTYSPIYSISPSPTASVSSNPTYSSSPTYSPSESPSPSASQSSSPSSSPSYLPSSSPGAYIPTRSSNALLSWRDLLAEAGVATQATKVKVIVDNNMPPAEFEKLPENVKFVPDMLQCADASQRSGGSKVFSEYVKNRSKCAQGIVDATVLGQKVSHMTTSIDAVNLILKSLQTTKAYADQLENLNGVVFGLIPFGGEQMQKYEQASAISMKCIQDIESTQKILAPVGTGGYSQGPLYIGATVEQSKAITKLKTEAAAITKYMQEEQTKSKDGKLSTGAAMSLMSKVMGLKSEGEKYLIPIIPSAIVENQSYLKEEDMIIFGFSGNGETYKVPGAIKFVLSAMIDLGKEPLSGGLLTFDTQQFTLYIPEKPMIEEFRTKIDKKIKEFTAKKIKYEEQMAKLQGEFDALSKKGYSCGGAELVSSGNINNPLPPPPPPSNSLLKSQASISTAKTSVGSDENINIKFESPANTTRTSVYISCPTGVSSLAAGFECNKLISLGKYFNSLNASFINRTSKVQKVNMKFYAYTSDREESIESFPLVISVNPRVVPPPAVVTPTYTPSYTSTPSYSPSSIPTYSTTPTYTSAPTYYSTPTYSSTPTVSASSSSSPSPTITTSPTPTVSSTPTYNPSYSTSPSSSPSSSASPSLSPISTLPMISNQNASLWDAIVEWFKSF